MLCVCWISAAESVKMYIIVAVATTERQQNSNWQDFSVTIYQIFLLSVSLSGSAVNGFSVGRMAGCDWPLSMLAAVDEIYQACKCGELCQLSRRFCETKTLMSLMGDRVNCLTQVCVENGRRNTLYVWSLVDFRRTVNVMWQEVLPRQLWCDAEDEVEAVCIHFTSTGAGKAAAVYVSCRSHDRRHKKHCH